MSLYECVLIARNDVTQQQVEGIADGIASQLETEGGAMKKREEVPERRVATTFPVSASTTSTTPSPLSTAILPYGPKTC